MEYFPWKKIWTNLRINGATQERQTSSVGKLYTIQFKYRSKIAKIGSMNGLCHFFLKYSSRNLETFILRLYSRTTKSYPC